MPKKRVEANGITLAYEDHGAGKPLLLLHGFCGSSLYWQKVIPLLAGHCRVIAPDLRGHGESEAPEEAVYSMEANADDIAALIQALDLDRPIVLGHSLGGYIALALAERYGELLSGFGLIHSTAYPDTEESRAGRDKGIATIRSEGITAFVDGLVPKLFAPEHLTSMPEAVEEAKRIGRGTSAAGAAATQEGMKRRPDRNSVLAETGLPVLLVAGLRDGIVPVEKTFSVRRASITCVELEEAGHMSMLETPDPLAEGILSFLSR
ncbi:alpha/beta fold hydrolase [Gorillibacterium timonense]|uniref:alpha/beta fold hydrolase n=1 Tax=Gorillibacterium timonense TaxID=1689269 RepID=UPI00071D395A|nr:alpha/beta hydrolase [Gorillibacterium timonense]